MNNEELCHRCNGDGWKSFPSWLRHLNGMCYRCEGSGLEPRSQAHMCGTLKFEKTSARRGEPIPCVNPATKKTGRAVWDGFAHSERSDWWKKEGNAVQVQVMADAFVEGDITLRVPKGHHIEGLGLRKDVMVQGRAAGRAKQVKILTRSPLNSFEKGIHKRWPVVYVEGKAFQWTENDVVSGPAQGQLFKEGTNGT